MNEQQITERLQECWGLSRYPRMDGEENGYKYIGFMLSESNTLVTHSGVTQEELDEQARSIGAEWQCDEE